MADRTHLQLHTVFDPRWVFGIFHFHAGGFEPHLVSDGHRTVCPLCDGLVSRFVIFMAQVSKDSLYGLVVRVPGYRSEIYRVFYEKRTEFIYVL
jgi:hypothetical protein